MDYYVLGKTIDEVGAILKIAQGQFEPVLSEGKVYIQSISRPEIIKLREKAQDLLVNVVQRGENKNPFAGESEEVANERAIKLAAWVSDLSNREIVNYLMSTEFELVGSGRHAAIIRKDLDLDGAKKKLSKVIKKAGAGSGEPGGKEKHWSPEEDKAAFEAENQEKGSD